MHDFVDAVNRYNLTTFYILPLTGLSIKDFGSANIVDTYIYPDGTHIVVRVQAMYNCNTQVSNHSAFAGKLVDGETVLLVYGIEKQWHEDVGAFLKGRYSKMSEKAKEAIMEGSGLSYKTKSTHTAQEITDARLLALYNSEVLRAKWAEILDVPIQELPEELMEAPKEDWYMELEFRKTF